MPAREGLVWRAPTPADAEAVGRMHHQAWVDAYGHLLPDDWFEHWTVDVVIAKWRGILTAPTPPGLTRIAVFDETGAAVAWVVAGPSRPDDDIEPVRPVELWGIYVAREHHGSGLARALAERAWATRRPSCGCSTATPGRRRSTASWASSAMASRRHTARPGCPASGWSAVARVSRVQISPSILSADFANLERELGAISNADWAHVDVMDNHFVPNLTLGLPVVEALVKVSPIPIDCHLMIDDPDRWAPGYAEAGARSVTFHVEAVGDAVATARAIRAAGARAAFAVKPGTPFAPYADLLPEVDMVLVMTVEPGFGGQSFMADQMPKVREVREAVRRHGGEVWIQVDGGVSAVDDRAVRRGRGRRLRRRVGGLRRRVRGCRGRRPARARGTARTRMSGTASLLERLADSGGYAVDLTLTEGLEPGEVLEGVELEGCRFERSVLEGAVLRDCTFTDCVFVGCNLNRVDLSGSRFSDCTFVECTALAVIWARAGEATLSARPWDLERCRLDLASFQEGSIAGSRLVGCSLREADFAAADAQRVDFGGSDLSGAVFVGTDLREANLVGAVGYAFDPSENRVRGLRVEALGAAGLLSAMGLVVEG